MRIPDALKWLRSSVEGGAWLDTLPRLVQACTAVWDLRVGEPYATSSVSLALPAGRADGSPAVLKIQLPDRESEHEADALARWGGEGAVRLLEWDPELYALFLERCDPGTPLSGSGSDGRFYGRPSRAQEADLPPVEHDVVIVSPPMRDQRSYRLVES